MTMTTKLPEEVIEQVLLRLPARSIVKVRSVCKLFNRLTTAPAFVAAHIRWFRGFVPNSLAVFQMGSWSDRAAIDVLHCSTIGTVRHQLVELEWDYVLAGACDGMLCFAKGKDNDEFAIVNLLTGECFSGPLSDNRDIMVLGFYYNAPSGEYRLLLEKHHSPVDNYFVYTVGPNTLREVENLCGYEPRCKAGGGVVIKGKLYFVGYKFGFGEVLASAMVVFDTESEEFTSFLLPTNEFDSQGDRVHKLLEIQGKLCAFEMLHGRNHSKLEVQLWVLTDLEKGTWIKKQQVDTKVFTGQVGNYTIVDYFEHYRVLLLMEYDENDIASPDKSFTFYCLEDRHIRIERPSIFLTKKYIETLASIEQYCSDNISVE